METYFSRLASFSQDSFQSSLEAKPVLQSDRLKHSVVGRVKEQVWLLAERIIINIKEIININKNY